MRRYINFGNLRIAASHFPALCLTDLSAHSANPRSFLMYGEPLHFRFFRQKDEQPDYIGLIQPLSPLFNKNSTHVHCSI